MAKKNKPAPAKRRKRISGIGGSFNGILLSALGVGVAAWAGNQISKYTVDKVDPRIVAGAKVLSVMVIPKFIPGPMGVALGNGFLATGAIELFQNFGISGIGDTADFGVSNGNLHLISGGNDQFISGINDNQDTGIDPMSSAIAGSM